MRTLHLGCGHHHRVSTGVLFEALQLDQASIELTSPHASGRTGVWSTDDGALVQYYGAPFKLESTMYATPHYAGSAGPNCRPKAVLRTTDASEVTPEFRASKIGTRAYVHSTVPASSSAQGRMRRLSHNHVLYSYDTSMGAVFVFAQRSTSIDVYNVPMEAASTYEHHTRPQAQRESHDQARPTSSSFRHHHHHHHHRHNLVMPPRSIPTYEHMACPSVRNDQLALGLSYSARAFESPTSRRAGRMNEAPNGLSTLL